MIEIKESDRDYTKFTPVAYLAFIVMFILVVGTGFYFKDIFFKDKQTGHDPEQIVKKSTKPAAIDDKPTEEQLAFLLSRNKYPVPATTNVVQIAPKNLPVNVIGLLNQVSEISAKSVGYSNGMNGYEVSFSLGVKLEDDFRTYLHSFDADVWKVVSASYTENAGVLTLESKQHSASAEFVGKENSTTTVTLRVIVKK